MSEVNTGADALQLFHSGAAHYGAGQHDPDACLGGKRSGTRIDPFTIIRDTPMAGIRIDYISGWNVQANASDRIAHLEAAGPDSLTWSLPGSATKGDAVTIANGETKMLTADSNASAYIVVTRTSATDLRGRESIQLRWNYNNVVAGGNWTKEEIDATPSLARYRCVFIKNTGDSAITSVNISGTGPVTFAEESGTSTDLAQTIADEETAPATVTFSATPSIASIAAGETHVVWIKVSSVTAAAEPQQVITFKLTYTYDSVSYTKFVAGYTRVSDDDQARWEVYLAEGADPDPDNDSPVTTTQTTSYSYVQDLTEGEWRVGIARRNKYGILGPLSRIKRFYVDSGGDQDDQAPLDPQTVQLLPTTDGAFAVVADYNPALEDDDPDVAYANRALEWLIYATVDGTDPDPNVDTPVVESMTGNASRLTQEVLYCETGEASLDNTPGKVIVRTRRGSVESKGTTIYTANSMNFGPPRPNAKALLGRSYGLPFARQAPPDGTENYIDAGNNIYWKPEAGSVFLYADTVLVWRMVYGESKTLFIPDGWDIVSGSVSGAGSDDAIETVSWTGGDKRLTVNVNGTRRMEIDVTNMTITFADWQSAAMPTIAKETDAWRRYTDTAFLVFDSDTENYVPYGLVDSDSAFQIASDVNVVAAFDQATVEAL